MTNKKITDLVELTTPTTDDVFPLVDIATNSTKKAQLANLPISTATQTALDAKQATLVSGTNIKTINSTSLLGSGNISIAANPAGTAGQIQFSDGSAFAADSNLFWDNTNKRLGVGTNSPMARLHAKSEGDTVATTIFRGQNLSGNDRLVLSSDGKFVLAQTGNRNVEVNPGGYIVVSNYTAGLNVTSKICAGSGSGLAAQMGVVGSGSTSATTSLLVQNSSGTDLLKVADNGDFTQLNGNIWNVKGYSYFQLATALSIFTVNNQYGRYYGTPFVFGNVVPETSAHLQVESTTKGFLPPRMTTTQKNAISSPAEGLMVMDITTHKLCVYDGTSWVDLH